MEEKLTGTEGPEGKQEKNDPNILPAPPASNSCVEFNLYLCFLANMSASENVLLE